MKTLLHKIEQRLFSATLMCTALLSTNDGCLHRNQSAACKQRGAALESRYETLKSEAHSKIKIGMKKADLTQFFAQHRIPLTFVSGEATGTMYTTGCAPTGCGSDAALLGLRVGVDDAGTAGSEPVVGALYTDCLSIFQTLSPPLVASFT